MPRCSSDGYLDVCDLEEDIPVIIHGEDGEHALEVWVDGLGQMYVQPQLRAPAGPDGREGPMQPVGAPIPFSALLKEPAAP